MLQNPMTITSLNVNVLKAPVERQSGKLDQKIKSNIMLSARNTCEKSEEKQTQNQRLVDNPSSK